MAIRKVVTYPSKILREKIPPTNFYDMLSVIADMDDLRDSLARYERGAAMAANQIALRTRVFLVANNPSNIPPYVFNPTYEKIGDETEIAGEGCLSFPGFSRGVERAKRIRATFDELVSKEGEVKRVSLELDGWWGRVFQHETDHLDGTLFVDDLPQNLREEIAMSVAKVKIGGKR